VLQALVNAGRGVCQAGAVEGKQEMPSIAVEKERAVAF